MVKSEQTSNVILKILYSISLGVIIAFFVGLGIEAFYPTEKYPEYPAELQSKDPSTLTAVQTQMQKEYDQTLKDYNERTSKHEKNVSIFAMAASIIIMVIGLLIIDKTNVFSNGLLLGSILTLFYSIARGIMSSDNKYRFILISVGLVVALVLGYIKFIKKEKDL